MWTQQRRHTVGPGAFWLLLALLMSSLAGSSARAEDDAEARRAEAVKLGHEAAEAYKAGNYADALEKYQAAYRLVPAPPLVLNLSRTALKLGRCDESLNYALTYSAAFGESDTASVESPQAWIASVKAQCAEVQITSEPPGASLTIDGASPGEAAVTPWKGRLLIGRHELRARLEGYVEQRQEVEVVSPEAVAEVRLELVRAPVAVAPPLLVTPPRPAATRLRWEPWLPAGAAVVGLALGITGGVLSLQCPTAAGTPVDVQNEKLCQYNRGGLADIGWGLAGAGAVTAAILWIVLKPLPASSEAPPVRVSVGNRVTLSGRF